MAGFDVEFANDELQRLATEPAYIGSFSVPIVKAYRKRLQQIHASTDERDLRFPGGNHFKRLDAPRSHQHSMRLNDQWRLVIEISTDGARKIARIVNIEDYH